MALERTFSIVKPDAVAKNHIGAIYNRFESAGLKIVASKMPGGEAALARYEEEAMKVTASAARTKAMVFRDPERYETISDHLLDTIYDIETPEEATEAIINALREEKK